MNGLIYHAFDTTNGKAYVGQTGGTFAKRRRLHLTAKANLPFANALRKRPRAFVWTVLTLGLMTQQELDDAEIYWGTYFDCLVPNGYNLKLGQGRVILSDEAQAQYNNPEIRARKSASLKITLACPEVKARRSTIQKIYWSDPEVRAQHSATAKIAFARPEVKIRRSESQKITWARPEVKARRSASLKAACARPEVKARKAAAANKPEVKARKSASMKAAWARRKTGDRG